MKRIRLDIGADKIVIDADGRVNEYPCFKGFMQLAVLLDNADKEISCLLLAADDILRVWEAERRMEKSRYISSPDDEPADAYHSVCGYEAEEMLDEKYVNELKAEAGKLIPRIAVAEEYNDLGRLEMLQEELAQITAHLLKSTTPEGKSKTFADEYKKPLDALRKSFVKTFGMIAEKDKLLAEHLSERIRIGRYCCYLSSHAEVICRRKSFRRKASR